MSALALTIIIYLIEHLMYINISLTYVIIVIMASGIITITCGAIKRRYISDTSDPPMIVHTDETKLREQRWGLLCGLFEQLIRKAVVSSWNHAETLKLHRMLYEQFLAQGQQFGADQVLTLKDLSCHDMRVIWASIGHRYLLPPDQQLQQEAVRTEAHQNVLVSATRGIAPGITDFNQFFSTYQVLPRLAILRAIFNSKTKTRKLANIFALIDSLYPQPPAETLKMIRTSYKEICLAVNYLFRSKTGRMMFPKEATGPPVSIDPPEFLQSADKDEEEPILDLTKNFDENMAEQRGRVREFMEDNAEVLRTGFGVAVFLAAITGFSTLLSVPDLNKLSADIVKLGSLCVSYHRVSSTIGTMLDTFMPWLYGVFGAEYTPAHLKLERNLRVQIEALYNRVLKFQHDMRVDVFGLARENDPSLFKQEVDTLMEHTRQVSDSSRSLYNYKQRLDQIYQIINDLHQRRNDLMSQAAGKQEPVVIQICGKSGVGKSRLVSALATRIAKHHKGTVYTRTLQDRYWSGYRGNTVCVMQDFGQEVDNEDHRTLHKYATTDAQDVMGAAIEAKGQKFNSRYIIISSNMTWFAASKTLNYIETLNRRRHFVVYAENEMAYTAYTKYGFPPTAEAFAANPTRFYWMMSAPPDDNKTLSNPPHEIGDNWRSDRSVFQPIDPDQLFEAAIEKEKECSNAYRSMVLNAGLFEEDYTVPPELEVDPRKFTPVALYHSLNRDRIVQNLEPYNVEQDLRDRAIEMGIDPIYEQQRAAAIQRYFDTLKEYMAQPPPLTSVVKLRAQEALLGLDELEAYERVTRCTENGPGWTTLIPVDGEYKFQIDEQRRMAMARERQQANFPHKRRSEMLKYPIGIMGPPGIGKTYIFKQAVQEQQQYIVRYEDGEVLPYDRVLFFDDITLNERRWTIFRDFTHAMHDNRNAYQRVFFTGNTTNAYMNSLAPQEKELVFRRCKVFNFEYKTHWATHPLQTASLKRNPSKFMKSLADSKERSFWLEGKSPNFPSGVGDLRMRGRKWGNGPRYPFRYCDMLNIIQQAFFSATGNWTLEIDYSYERAPFVIPVPSDLEFIIGIPCSWELLARGDLITQPDFFKSCSVRRVRNGNMCEQQITWRETIRVATIVASFAHDRTAGTAEQFVVGFNEQQHAATITFPTTILLTNDGYHIGFACHNGIAYAFITDESKLRILPGRRIEINGEIVEVDCKPNERFRDFILSRKFDSSITLGHVLSGETTEQIERATLDEEWKTMPMVRAMETLANLTQAGLRTAGVMMLMMSDDVETESEQEEDEATNRSTKKKTKAKVSPHDTTQMKSRPTTEEPVVDEALQKLKDDMSQLMLNYEATNRASKKQVKKKSVSPHETGQLKNRQPLEPVELDEDFLNGQFEEEEPEKTNRKQKKQAQQPQQHIDPGETVGGKVRTPQDTIYVDEALPDEVEATEHAHGALMYHHKNGYGIKQGNRVVYAIQASRNIYRVKQSTVMLGWQPVSFVNDTIEVTVNNSRKTTPIAITRIALYEEMLNATIGKELVGKGDLNSQFALLIACGLPIDLMSRRLDSNAFIQMHTSLNLALPEVVVAKLRAHWGDVAVKQFVVPEQPEGTLDAQALVVAKMVKKNVVHMYNAQRIFLCSGIMTHSRCGITVAHIFEDGPIQIKTSDGQFYEVVLVKTRAANDVAAFRVPDNKCPEFANIRTKFATRAYIAKRFSGTCAVPAIFAKTDENRDLLVERTTVKTYSVTVGGEDGCYNQYLKGFGVIGQSTRGDCGSLVYVMDSTTMAKVLGIHKAGSTVNSRFAFVSQESLMTLFDEQLESSAPIYEMSREIEVLEKPVGEGQVTVGYLRGKAYVPCKTRRYKTGYEAPSECEHFEPTVTSMTDPRNPGRKMVSEAVDRYDAPDLPDSMRDEVRDAFTEIGNYIVNQCVNTGRDLRVLNSTESINGNDVDYTALNPIDRTGSVGFPHATKSRGKRTTKGDYLEQNPSDGLWYFRSDPASKQIQANVNFLIMRAKKNVTHLTPWVAYPKDEVVAKKKIYGDSAKTRSFFSGPMEYHLAYRKYFGAALARVTEMHATLPVKIGVNACGEEWEEFYYQLAKVSMMGFCADAKFWDAHMPRMFTEEMAMMFNMMYQELDPKHDEEDDVVRIALHRNVERPVVLVAKTARQFRCGQISGFPGTAPENSIQHWALAYMVYKRLAIAHGAYDMATFAVFMEKIGQGYYGDDSIYTVAHDAQEFFHFNSFVEEARNFGFEFTSSNKSGDAEPNLRSLNELDFLKRNFAHVMDRIVGPISLNSLGKHLEWIQHAPAYDINDDGERYKVCDDLDKISQSIDMMWPELALHGQQQYHQWRRAIVNQSTNIGIAVNPPMWGAAFLQNFE